MAALSPANLLPLLLGGAIAAGGLLQGLHWRRTADQGGAGGMAEPLRAAHEEIAALKREIEALRSLAKDGAEFAVPQEFIDRVEHDYDLAFLTGPVVRRIAREQLRERIGAAVESRFGPAGIEDRQEAYTLLGWLAAEHPLLDDLTAVQAVGTRGWFDDVSGEAWVTDRFQVEEIPDQATLMRLLTRILLHQHFPPPPAYPGDDVDRARLALHHGTAAGSEARHYAANARAIGFVPMKRDPAAARMLATLAPLVRQVSQFPATAGKGYADALYLRGKKALLAAFRNPPQSTRAILQPGTPAAAPPPLALPAGVPPAATEGENYLTEVAGQLGLALWLDPDGGSPAAAEAARPWSNDRYQLFPDGETEVALIWEIELTDAAAVDQLLPLALARLATLAGSDTPASLNTPLAAKDGRHLQLSRPAPERLRFLNAASAATAAQRR